MLAGMTLRDDINKAVDRMKAFRDGDGIPRNEADSTEAMVNQRFSRDGGNVFEQDPAELAAIREAAQAALALERDLSGGFDTTTPLETLAAAWGHDGIGCPVEKLMEHVSDFRGGHLDLYKPGLAIDYYEHDDIASVLLTRCKASPIASPDCVVFTSPDFWGRDCIRRALLWTALVLRKGGAK